MRIRSSVNPTPIVSPVPLQQKAEAQPAPVAAPAPKVEVGPLLVDLGDKEIQLQPGELAKVVDKLNETARIFNYALHFEMSEGKQVVVKVVDTVSGQIVREIPPERMLEAFNRMEAALGLLIDLRA